MKSTWDVQLQLLVIVSRLCRPIRPPNTIVSIVRVSSILAVPVIDEGVSKFAIAETSTKAVAYSQSAFPWTFSVFQQECLHVMMKPVKHVSEMTYFVSDWNVKARNSNPLSLWTLFSDWNCTCLALCDTHSDWLVAQSQQRSSTRYTNWTTVNRSVWWSASEQLCFTVLAAEAIKHGRPKSSADCKHSFILLPTPRLA